MISISGCRAVQPPHEKLAVSIHYQKPLTCQPPGIGDELNSADSTAHSGDGINCGMRWQNQLMVVITDGWNRGMESNGGIGRGKLAVKSSDGAKGGIEPWNWVMESGDGINGRIEQWNQRWN